jgi:hypothetical protein
MVASPSTRLWEVNFVIYTPSSGHGGVRRDWAADTAFFIEHGSFGGVARGGTKGRIFLDTLLP